MKATVSRAMLQRLPIYLGELKRTETDNVSATALARAVGFGEVMVRKDLGVVSGSGKPRVGYNTCELIGQIENFLGVNELSDAVIVGAGHLGLALLEYRGFERYGVHIAAAFDCDRDKLRQADDKAVYSTDEFADYCRKHDIRIGIITVPASCAESVCAMMLQAGIRAIWNFTAVELETPEDVAVINERLALSLSMLRQQIH